MVNILQALFLAVLQGVAAILPVSSLGHMVIFPGLLQWNIDQDGNSFLAFLVMLHAASGLAIMYYYYRDWIHVIKSLVKLAKRKKRTGEYYEHLGLLIIIGLIPVLIASLIFEVNVKEIFTSPMLVAAFLVINGFVLFGADSINRYVKARKIQALNDLHLDKALIIGFFQSIALLPGLSKPGVSMSGGILLGLNYEDSAKLSFMMIGPAVFFEAIIETGYVIYNPDVLFTSFVCAVIAGVGSYLILRYLLKYLRSGSLIPFAYYSWTIGILGLLVFKFIF